jgi:hypothetical protein
LDFIDSKSSNKYNFQRTGSSRPLRWSLRRCSFPLQRENSACIVSGELFELAPRFCLARLQAQDLLRIETLFFNPNLKTLNSARVRKRELPRISFDLVHLVEILRGVGWALAAGKEHDARHSR